GDQLELISGLSDDGCVNAIRNGWNQDMRGFHRLREVGLAHRLVVEIKLRVEQLAHAGLDPVGQLASDDDDRLLGFGHVSRRGWRRSPQDQPPTGFLRSVQASLTLPPDTAFLFVGGSGWNSLPEDPVRTRRSRVCGPRVWCCACSHTSLGAAPTRQ